MAIGERIAADVSGPLFRQARRAVLTSAIFVLVAFAFSTRAQADCLSDIVNAVENTASALDSPQCQTAFAESSLVTTGLTAALEADHNSPIKSATPSMTPPSWVP